MTDLSNPHDKFFKEVFSRQEAARDFVLNYLPEEISGLIDTDTMEPTKESFVDKELREHFSDVLYKTVLRRGGEAYLYLLFEHKSYPEPTIAFQLLRYMVRIWESWLKEKKGEPFPSIIPIVIYHGKKEWKARPDFHALFADSERLRVFIPDFRHILCDLSSYEDGEIRGAVILKAALLIMKHIFSDDLANQLPGILRLLKNLLEKRSGMEYLETILRYVVAGSGSIKANKLKEIVSESFKDMGGNLMGTIAEEWFEQGMRQGMRQGMQQGIRQGLLKEARESVIEILEARFGKVPAPLIRRIESIEDLSVLKTLRKKTILADSLEQFMKQMET